MCHYSINVCNLVKNYYPKNSNTKLHREERCVLKDISFKVNSGEIVGIIGGNGSGKSTLLSILAGIIIPSSGNVEINGNVVSILELSLGFDHELSGKENIVRKGLSYGISRKEMVSKIDEIITFAELEDYADLALKTYSSGMIARLAFSIIVHLNGDILLIDEVLSVGDAFFSSKASDFFDKSISCKKIVILVSHSIVDIQKMCTRAIWLENGTIMEDGPVEGVCRHYLTYTTESIVAIKKLANANVASAQYKLAKYYLSGIYVDKNYNKYVELIQQSAKSGYPDSLYELAIIEAKNENNDESNSLLYLAACKGCEKAKIKLAQKTGVNVLITSEDLSKYSWNLSFLHNYAMSILDSNPEDALCILEKNSYKNYCLSLRELGICYLYGKCTLKDTSLALMYLNRAAEQYDPISINLLYNIYTSGDLLEKNDEMSFKYGMMGATIGDSNLQFEVFKKYSEGKGVEKSSIESEKWLGNYKLSYNFNSYLNIVSSLNGDDCFHLKIKILNDLCKAHCIEAYYQKGILLEKKSKTDEAIECLTYASSRGHTLAMYNLADMIFNHKKIEMYALAIKNYRKASMNGNYYALVKMALLYREIGNLDVSIYYLELAKRMKDPWPVMELYNSYFKRNKEGDLRKAFLLALENSDDDEFKVRLGVSYRDGIGVEADLDLAINYLESVKNKSDYAIKELIITREKMGWGGNA